MAKVYHLILYITLTHVIEFHVFSELKKNTALFSEIAKFTVEYLLQQLLSVVPLALPLFLCYVMGIFIPIE